MKRRYTWKPDIPDFRDHMLRASLVPGGLPSRVDLRPMMSPVEDQGQLGSCTANAIAGALEYLELKAAQPLVDVSRLFTYYGERVLEHTTKSDDGAMIRDGVKVCHKTGYCSEKTWPYVISKFAVKPPPKAYAEAKLHKITEYVRCDTMAACQQSLADGFPVVFGFSVYDQFESAQVANGGVLNMPAKGEQLLGGHAVLMVGYDANTKRVIVRNSWGVSWGQKGYFTMPFEYIEDRNLSDDFWSIRK